MVQEIEITDLIHTFMSEEAEKTSFRPAILFVGRGRRERQNLDGV